MYLGEKIGVVFFTNKKITYLGCFPLGYSHRGNIILSPLVADPLVNTNWGRDHKGLKKIPLALPKGFILRPYVPSPNFHFPLDQSLKGVQVVRSKISGSLH